ncbi:hypothetical protein AB0H76_23430 [Nocardia sp. NPDC050712]|uniref:hypothetical protein n=1 Tax=Nocardia sp. NPDC050712 TaxID=3155518 RepID=UPI0033DB1E9C
MFESCHSPHEVAHLLRRRFGLPVQLLAGRPIITTGSILGALVMPPHLGCEVLGAMDSDLRAPVVADPGNRTWTFLVTPPSPVKMVDIGVRQHLAAHQVTVVPSGRFILLPTTDSLLGWHWAAEPAPGVLRLPPRSAVIEAVHRVIELHAPAP